MLGKPGKGEISLVCSNAVFAEFPQLLFGVSEENQRSYFDATKFLSQGTEPIPLQPFFTHYRYQIKSLCDAWDLKADEVCLVNQEGHYLIDGAFVFLFISFVEPGFLAFMCDRIFEVFTQGVTVSDSYLLASARRRLPKEVLTATNDDEQKSV